MPDFGPAINHHVALQHAIIADLDTVFDHHVRPDRRIPPKLDVRRDDGGGVNSRGRPVGSMEKLQGLGKREVGIRRAQRRPAPQILTRIGNDGGRAGGRELAKVPGISKESQLSGSGFVHARHPRDFEFFRTLQPALKPDCNLTKFHLFLLFIADPADDFR